MDSNFSVKITADISDLQARLKSVEQALGTFKKSADDASTGMTKMNNEAGRGRLVAFAFGQVIRDAGFFANDFGLGLLAISNNIPILIDQLVMMSNVSKGLGVALSLAGSVITAALTVVAYTMMYTKKAAQEFNNELAKNTGEAEKNALVLKTLIGIAKDETLSLAQRQDAVNKINNEYKEFNNSLTVAGASSRKTTDLVDRLSQSMLLNAQATALANEYSRISTELFKAQNTPLAQQADLLDKAVVYWRSFLDFLNPFTGDKNPIKDFTDGARAGLTKFGLENFTSKTNEFKNSMGLLQGQLKGVLEKITALQLTKPPKQPLGELEKSTIIVDEKMKAIRSAINSYKDALSDIELTPGIKPFEVKKQSLEALGDLITKLKAIDGTERTVAKLTEKFNEMNIALGGMQFGLPLFDMIPKMIQRAREESVRELEMLKMQIDDIFINGIANTIGSGMYAIGEAFATGGNVIKSFGSAVLASISQVLSQFADKLIVASLAGLTFSNAMKNLFDPKNWALALAAGIALKVAAGAAGGFARSLSGGGGGMGGGMSASPTPTFGGINTFSANTGMNAGSSIGNMLNSQTVLETRISGNDLVILMNRASNNRNNYF